MIFYNGQIVTPVAYVWGSGLATVRFEDGVTVTIPWTKLTSPQGETYVAQILRDVRTA